VTSKHTMRTFANINLGKSSVVNSVLDVVDLAETVGAALGVLTGTLLTSHRVPLVVALQMW